MIATVSTSTSATVGFGPGRSPTPANHAVLALGTNVGSLVNNVREAVAMLESEGVVTERHSGLYSTTPVSPGVTQSRFLNAAVLVSTDAGPAELLRRVKRVERRMGRETGGVRWGPRVMDIDIIFFNGAGSFTSPPLRLRDAEGRPLAVPHPRWRGRDFVVAPVADLRDARDDGEGQVGFRAALLRQVGAAGRLWDTRRARGARARAAAARNDPDAFLRDRVAANEGGGGSGRVEQSVYPAVGPAVVDSGPAGEWGSTGEAAFSRDVWRVMPVPGVTGGLVCWERRPHVMGILNATPDSFSDGGVLGAMSPRIGEDMHVSSLAAVATAAVEAARRMVAAGAAVVDVGGQSTRPGADPVPSAVEAARVVPVVRALRACPDLAMVPISVDTFDSRVAEAAIAAGAGIVNDVSGGSLCPEGGMHAMVARLGVPYVLMHMRGNPKTMTSLASYSPGGLVAEVAGELAIQADAAVAAGIEPWRVILDPGLGFAKTPGSSIALSRACPEVRAALPTGTLRGAPLLVGPSRKGFLGVLTGHTVPADRDAATAASVAALVGGGVEILRVHDVPSCVDAARVGHALLTPP